MRQNKSLYLSCFMQAIAFLVILAPRQASADDGQLDRIEKKLDKLQNDIDVLKSVLLPHSGDVKGGISRGDESEKPGLLSSIFGKNLNKNAEQKNSAENKKDILSNIGGRWVDVAGASEIIINRDGKVFSTEQNDSGQISNTSEKGANIEMQKSDSKCLYHVSFINGGNGAIWKSMTPDKTTCQTRTYQKSTDTP